MPKSASKLPEHTTLGPQVSTLSKLADEADLGLVLLDEHDRVTYANAGFHTLLGCEDDDVRGQSLASLLNAPFETNALRQGEARQEILVQSRDARSIWLSVFLQPVFGESGFQNLAVVLRDITDEKIQALQRDALELMAVETSLDTLSNLICLYAKALVPGTICSILYVDSHLRLRPLAAPGLPAPYVAALDGLAAGPIAGACGTAAYRGEAVFVESIASDPLWEPYRSLPLPAGIDACWSSPIKLKNGRTAGTFAFYLGQGCHPNNLHQKIVDACVHLCSLAFERYEADIRINRLAYFDDLTGLPNRRRLTADIERCLARAAPAATTALLCIDMDHFKYINDTLGHAIGDQLLAEIARRLSSVPRPEAVFGRMGSNEFVMALPETGMDEATAIAAEILRVVSEPVFVSGTSLPVSASIGIALHPQDASAGDELLMRAGMALDGAKRDGRRKHKFFTQDMSRRGEERVILGAALRDSLAQGGLHLHYQPQMRIAEGTLYGVEALARWTHPTLGAITPDRFIPVAEEFGLIDTLGAWALDSACRQMAAWRAAGIPVPTISVNLSPLQFRNPELPSIIDALLRKHALMPHMLTLEITESVMMDVGQTASTILGIIHASGVGLSIDDFGTGYSNLASLARLPLSEIKIDRAFIHDIGEEANASAVVMAVIRIGQSLGMTVIAEGVETQKQQQRLQELGCHVSQGFFHGKPMDSAALATWISAHQPPA